MRVIVSGTAMAYEDQGEHVALRDAIRTEGRSAVEEVLDMDDPPEVLQFSTMGGPFLPSGDRPLKVKPHEEHHLVIHSARHAHTADEVTLETDWSTFEVHWTKLSDGPTVWMVEARAADGTLLGSGVGDNAEDAILGVAEDLLPPKD